MPRTDETALEGGCHCRTLRYRVILPMIDSGYCHCRLCQATTGAPALAWATFPSTQFTWSKGTPKLYHASPKGIRAFCGTCGTQILFRDLDLPERRDINLITLDDPTRLAPQYHIWTDSRVSWFDTSDTLPRYRDQGPDV